MIKFLSYTNTNALDALKLWNTEVGYIFPITDVIYYQNVVNNKYLLPDASFVVYDNEKTVGFIIVKKWNNDDIIASYKNIGWISLFYVAKKYRRQGIGSRLLAMAENKLSFYNINNIQIGKDINNFFPGIPADFDNLTANWLEKRGYTIGRYTHDLILRNKDMQYTISNKNIAYQVLTLEYKNSFLEMIKASFPGRWFFECNNYFENGGFGNEYIIALDGQKVVGFARINDLTFHEYHYNVTWHLRFSKLGGLGPLGVDREFRGKKIGGDILSYALNELKKRGCDDILIDWTGLLELYQKYGFEVWKCYQYAFKEIKFIVD